MDQKLPPDVWKLKSVIEEQRRIIAATKSAHYVLGPGATFDDADDPKKKAMKEFFKRRMDALEARIKRLSKRLDKVETKLGKKKR